LHKIPIDETPVDDATIVFVDVIAVGMGWTPTVVPIGLLYGSTSERMGAARRQIPKTLGIAHEKIVAVTTSISAVGFFQMAEKVGSERNENLVH
jgi:hypothetical protein